MMTQTRNKNPWHLTFSGLMVDLLHPMANTISISDITISLCRKARFNGHTVGAIETYYSVAQHSCLVHDEACKLTADPNIRLAALLHDAPEAYLPDVHSDLKPLLRGFREMEDRFEQVIHDRFFPEGWFYSRPVRMEPVPGTDMLLKDLINHIDKRMLATEMRDVMPKNSPIHTEHSYQGYEAYIDRVTMWRPEASYRNFLTRFNQCTGLQKPTETAH